MQIYLNRRILREITLSTSNNSLVALEAFLLLDIAVEYS